MQDEPIVEDFQVLLGVRRGLDRAKHALTGKLNGLAERATMEVLNAELSKVNGELTVAVNTSNRADEIAGNYEFPPEAYQEYLVQV